MSDILKGLNREQKEAVLQDRGTVLILAGAGCGKTKVLTSRIANLINNGVSPYEILAVTFTNKAAKEMKERLALMTGAENAGKIRAGTFHSTAGWILRQDIEEYKDPNGHKYDKNFVIYDDSDTNTIIKTALKNCNLDENIYQPKLIKPVISNAKNKMYDAYTYETHARDYRSGQYAKIFSEYQRLLQENNALDFDDMLVLAVKLLEQSDKVREKYFNRFKHILVDEFQDTNVCQYKMVTALYTNNKEEDEIPPEKSLCVVGDIDQSIYSWRGADYRILLNLQSTFKKTHLIKLEQNYRSTGIILEAANAVISSNTERISKNLYSNLGRGGNIELYSADDELDEARHVITEVKRLMRESNLDDAAVLYRTNAQSRAIEEACTAANIPYRIAGGIKFYERKEIKDITAYLKLIYNPHDSQSFKRIVNAPKRGIGAETVNKIFEAAKNDNNAHFIDVLQNIEQYSGFSAAVKTKLKSFYTLFSDLQNAASKMDIPALIGYTAEKTGYLEDIKQTEDEETYNNKKENIEELINAASEFVPQDDDILGGFLSQISLASDIDSLEEGSHALTLMTLHSAKGLEFDTVFLTGLEEGTFPSGRSLDNNSAMEEERRLMYVGITRAKQKLYISYAKRRRVRGEYKYMNPSRFIEEIPAELIDYSESDGISSYNYSNSYSRSAYGQQENKAAAYSKASYIRKEEAPRSSQGGYNNYPKRNLEENSDGSIKSVSSFGKGFIAPNRKIQHNTSFVVKSRNHDINREERRKAENEKIAELMENNPIKKMLLEKKQKEAAEAVKTPHYEKIQESGEAGFKAGDRVFHSKYGIGKVIAAKEDAVEVDFGKSGQRTLDAAFSQLKKF